MIATFRTRRRRGTFLIETAAAGLMLILAMIAVTRVVASVAAERRVWHRREVATSAAANLMERLGAKPFEAMAVGPVPDLSLSPADAASLPGAELNVDVVTEERDGVPEAKRLALRLRWRNPAGQWDAPVRLTTWIHRRKEKP